MATTKVQSALQSAGNSKAFAGNVVSGNLLTARIVWQGAAGITLNSVTDTQGNTWTIHASTLQRQTTLTQYMQIASCIAGSSAACTVTATLSSGTAKSIAIDEWNNAAGGLVFDVGSANSGVSATLNSSSATTTAANGFGISMCAADASLGGAFTTPDAGWTDQQSYTPYWYVDDLYQLDLGAAGSKSAGETLVSAASKNWACNFAAFKVAAASGSTGTVNYTNVNDTVSASGTTTVTGSLATTNANDTCSASGTAGSVSGTVAYTNADDTSAASGTTTVTGSLARTNANDTVSASGTTTIVGSSVTTNANDTCAASGSVGNAVSGSVNYTNANDSVSASGTTTVTGSLSRTNSNDTVAASGSTTVLGSSSTTNTNDTLVASGIVGSVTGTVAYINNNDACAASGTAGNPQQGGHYGGATLDRKRKKERRHDDPDKAELRRSLENLVDGKVEQLKEEIAQPEIPQEIKKQAANIIKAYQKPDIDLTVINNDIEEIRTLLRAEIRRQQDEDEELLFMLL